LRFEALALLLGRLLIFGELFEARLLLVGLLHVAGDELARRACRLSLCIEGHGEQEEEKELAFHRGPPEIFSRVPEPARRVPGVDRLSLQAAGGLRRISRTFGVIIS
jgi:hypothetical protein